jgi:uncharacterized BrkB/YihY/UPF0761 family membrane protein
VSKPGDGRTRRLQKPIASARRYQQRLQRRPLVAFSLESVRRFNTIDGKHLALVIALNLFVAVIPLIIIGYAFIQAFNPRRDVGTLIAGKLHLTGSTAQIVKGTFTNASSGKSVALSISLISLLITGLDVSATAQVAYARAFTMTRCAASQVPARRRVADLAARGHWRRPDAAVRGSQPFALAGGRGRRRAGCAAVRVLPRQPRLLLDLPFAWRDLIPGAAICTGAAIVVHTVSALFLRNWLGAYGHAYGGFGISLALAAFTGIIASFWVWIAAVMGVWWERKAGPAAVAKNGKTVSRHRHRRAIAGFGRRCR